MRVASPARTASVASSGYGEKQAYKVFDGANPSLADIVTPLAGVFEGPMVFLDTARADRGHRFSYLCLGLHDVVRCDSAGCDAKATGDCESAGEGFFEQLAQSVRPWPCRTVPAAVADAGFADASLLHGGMVGYIGYGVADGSVQRDVAHRAGMRGTVAGVPASQAMMGRPAVVVCQDIRTRRIAVGADTGFDGWDAAIAAVGECVQRQDWCNPATERAPFVANAETAAALHACVDGAPFVKVTGGHRGNRCSGMDNRSGVKGMPDDAANVRDDALPDDWTADMTREEYCAAVERVKAHETEGDAYVVNLTQRIHGPRCADPWGAYLRLRALTPAPYSAYADDGRGTVLCCSSMERFLTVRGSRALTSPIKGTAARGSDDERDAASRVSLAHSGKDHAELMMVVDLERNDMSRCCRPGSIIVPAPPRIEAYSTVFQLVCDVVGELAGPAPLRTVRLLRHMFPGGSVTGAPKESAMRIIGNIERSPRGAYTGCVGYLADGGDADFAVVIRTMECDAHGCRLGVGGGITHESDPQSEYDEMLLKSRAVIDAFLPFQEGERPENSLQADLRQENPRHRNSQQEGRRMAIREGGDAHGADSNE